MKRLSLSFALLVLGTPAWGASGIYWHEEAAADDPRPWVRTGVPSEYDSDPYAEDQYQQLRASRLARVPTTTAPANRDEGGKLVTQLGHDLVRAKFAICGDDYFTIVTSGWQSDRGNSEPTLIQMKQLRFNTAYEGLIGFSDSTVESLRNAFGLPAEESLSADALNGIAHQDALHFSAPVMRSSTSRGWDPWMDQWGESYQVTHSQGKWLVDSPYRFYKPAANCQQLLAPTGYRRTAIARISEPRRRASPPPTGGGRRGLEISRAAAGQYEAVQYAKVFRAPNVDSEVLATIKPGWKVTVTEQVGDFFKIQSKSSRPPGYVVTDHLVAKDRGSHTSGGPTQARSTVQPPALGMYRILRDTPGRVRPDDGAVVARWYKANQQGMVIGSAQGFVQMYTSPMEDAVWVNAADVEFMRKAGP